MITDLDCLKLRRHMRVGGRGGTQACFPRCGHTTSMITTWLGNRNLIVVYSVKKIREFDRI